jgi:hypothetical protein
VSFSRASREKEDTRRLNRKGRLETGLGGSSDGSPLGRPIVFVSFGG